MLGGAQLVAFAATADAARARTFYQDTLGLRLVTDDAFALAFDCRGTPLRIQKVKEVRPPPFTVLGWTVPDLRQTVTTLGKQGVSFERYPFLEQDALGIWAAPSGTRVAWFKDPDGNLLSVSQSGAR